MSLGLVSADADRIFLAAESEGLPSGVIPSKLKILQEDPHFTIVVTGGLEHWRDVFQSYKAQLTIDAACDEVVRLLNIAMTNKNRAYGRLCGYENDEPVCWRIDRSVGEDAVSKVRIPLVDVEVIGFHKHTKAALIYAKTAICKGTGHQAALRDAIQSRILVGPRVQGPVETMVIERV